MRIRVEFFLGMEDAVRLVIEAGADRVAGTVLVLLYVRGLIHEDDGVLCV